MGISYKKLREIQNRQMTELSRMTPDNVKLFNQISSIARSTTADEKTQEEWILSAGKEIVQAQQDGRSAHELYGSDLEAAVHTGLGLEEEEDSAASEQPKSLETNSTEPQQQKQPRTPKWYAMIAWASVSFILLIQGGAGLIIGWTDGDIEPFSHISLFSIIVAAVGGIALVEMLRRLAERPDDQGADRNAVPKVNLRGIVIYLAVVVLVLFVGYPLRDSLPVFNLAPWVSLVIGIIGLALLRPLFGQKKG
ncbi:hypothetical protein ASD24_20865 [Paenibacillus sp. Root52]|uniref:DUF1129 family protein n=1 Tax=Paenibacillus sp. Root52 TaxID=1736552 RepID=UPI0006FF14F5|nr:DUF1129 family protein [Paenibacillus sp. Root52]KQY93622.1 hypothetical protein ASD24_20865 [Paenibacillus sp. Root52]